MILRRASSSFLFANASASATARTRAVVGPGLSLYSREFTGSVNTSMKDRFYFQKNDAISANGVTCLHQSIRHGSSIKVLVQTHTRQHYFHFSH